MDGPLERDTDPKGRKRSGLTRPGTITAPLLDSTDYGRPRIDRSFVESGRLVAAIIGDSQGARLEMKVESTSRRTCRAVVPVGGDSTTQRVAEKQLANAAGRRGTSPRSARALPDYLLRPRGPEVMRTSTAEANAAAVPAAPVRKQERARRRLHPASECQAGHEADGGCTNT